MRTIDLNADVGEGFATDAELIPLLTSANIACGGHAGDQRSMAAAVRRAVESGVAIGAHPGHEDRAHFGRRELPITPRELIDLLNGQVDRLHAIADGLGGRVSYLKLHGALYHQVGRDEALADAAIDFVICYHTPLSVLGRNGSQLARAADHADVPFYAEAFADRAYSPDGALVSRDSPAAVLGDTDAIANQVHELIHVGEALVINREARFCEIESLCLHGDHPSALENAVAVRTALCQAGCTLRAFSA
ncbi:5-oxoprolinase subunit PxpA [Botrimarina sp.]|uniref:5-oxoprolinase subunit PxpA n=1 Tax=Botrimarina sp. TaxID=2795802 RepID=UPI0032EC0CF0